jgi:hypothetical protein
MLLHGAGSVRIVRLLKILLSRRKNILRLASGMCEITDRLNRRTYWLAILAVALAVWGLTDVRQRAKTDPHNLGAHRSDFTVYTTAGAAMFDGRDPYAVANPRGWHYLYPPLFAILVSPLAKLDSQWQGVIWYAISLLTLWGCYVESRRLWRWLCDTPEPLGKNSRGTAAVESSQQPTSSSQKLSTLPVYFFWLAGATVLLPVLNCLQRGQVGILLTYLLLLGFRYVVTSRTLVRALVGGVILALPVAIKMIPALPVGILCLLLLSAAALHHWAHDWMQRAVGVMLGSFLGLWLFLLVIPSVILGPTANARHLNTWYTNVVLNENGVSDDDFSAHTKRNQSLPNGIYRLGNWIAYLAGDIPDDQVIDNFATRNTPMPMDNAWMAWIVRSVQIVLLGLLLAAAWKAARSGGELETACVFALSCLLMSAISPVFRGHYYMLWLPAAWLLPLVCWRNNRPQWALGLAMAACTLTWTHYVLLEWAGRVGVLGLGASIWYVAATVCVLCGKPAVNVVTESTRSQLRSAA